MPFKLYIYLGAFATYCDPILVSIYLKPVLYSATTFQVHTAVESVPKSLQNLASGSLVSAFIESRKAIVASGIGLDTSFETCSFDDEGKASSTFLGILFKSAWSFHLVSCVFILTFFALNP